MTGLKLGRTMPLPAVRADGLRGSGNASAGEGTEPAQGRRAGQNWWPLAEGLIMSRTGAGLLACIVIGTVAGCGFIKVAGTPTPSGPSLPTASANSAVVASAPPVEQPLAQSPASRPAAPPLPPPAQSPLAPASPSLPPPPPSKASGTVIFTNSCGSDLTIRQGLQVSAGPTVFNVQATVVAPTGHPVAAPIVAAKSGSQGNVPAGAVNAITGGSFPCITVTNPSPTTGGTD